MIDGIDLHHGDFRYLFDKVQEAKAALRSYAEPFVRHVLDGSYLDETNTWTGWEVNPVYKNGVLIALDFVGILYDDRGPTQRKIERVTFSLFDPATYNL